MKTRFIISLFILSCAVFPLSLTAHAQKKPNITPATHMWVKSGQSTMTFIPVNSLEQCQMLAQQAAILNSVQAGCFNGERLVKKFSCTKPLKESEQPSCG